MRCVKPARRSLLALALVASSLFAQSADPDLQRIRSDIARLKERLADVRKQAQSVEAEVEAADLELGIRTRELDITLETHARLESERAAIAAQIADLIPRIERQKKSLGKRLVALYRLGGLSYVRMFLTVGQQEDPSAAMSMLSFLVSHDARMIQRYMDSRVELALRNEQLAAQQVKLAAASKLIEEQRADTATGDAQRNAPQKQPEHG